MSETESYSYTALFLVAIDADASIANGRLIVEPATRFAHRIYAGVVIGAAAEMTNARRVTAGLEEDPFRLV
jgi:hypothetical protein